ncbi:MAG: hypothetical protein IT371_14520 [Deltaproteobacteria bacterium]|nr:hypothetical protein [Deltaproteobacteria bacterium]
MPPRRPRKGPREGPRQKRALSQVGGAVRLEGDRELAEAIAHCLKVRPGTGLDRYTHGFHTYPARMHPHTAGRLVRLVAAPGELILDPFCGSGTVLLEALLAERRAIGRDLSPLAVRLARLRCRRTSQTERRALRELGHRIGGVASKRARDGHAPPPLARPVLAPEGSASADARVRSPWEGPTARLYDPATLRELAWLAFEVSSLEDPFAREALGLVLSSLLVKASRRTSDTDPRVARQVRAPFPVGPAFTERAEELGRLLKALAADLPREPETARALDLAVDDARQLRTVGDASVDVVITSPPYASVYDYVEHHELRTDWLGLDDGAFRRGEVGSRRSFTDPDAGLARWHTDGRAWLKAVARVLKPGGRVVVLGGDGASSQGPIPFDRSLASWAEPAGLTLRATASQRRTTFDPETERAYRGASRREHLMLLGHADEKLARTGLQPRQSRPSDGPPRETREGAGGRPPSRGPRAGARPPRRRGPPRQSS